MPYHVGEKGSYGCSGYPAVKDDGTVMGCHNTKEQAANQIYAINQSEGNIKSMDSEMDKYKNSGIDRSFFDNSRSMKQQLTEIFKRERSMETRRRLAAFGRTDNPQATKEHTVNLGSTGSNNDSGMMDNGGMTGSNNSQFSGTDIMFAQMMIVHHQQALDMAMLAETRASNPEVKKLAAQIKSEQSPEITQMKGWLKTANAPMEMGHDMGMGGLLTDAQMTALKNASGAAFDKLFLEAMIAHHKGAIQMAQMVTESNNAEVKALGNAIITSQTKQIAYMKELLAKM